MIPKNLKELFSEIRNCQKCKNESIRIDCSQAGLFLGTKYLFIAQNPSFPKPDLIPSDKIIMDKNSTDEEFHNAYKKSQLSWKFYNYIKEIIGDSMDFSIINVVRCPTKDNAPITDTMIFNCKPFLLKTIELINPKNIILVGRVAQDEIDKLRLSYKYNIIHSPHYSFLLRMGRWYTEEEIKKVKERLE